MWKIIKGFFVGDPIATNLAHHERLNNKTALAVFSSDALSSVAYSTEAILLVLLAAGSIAIGYLVPISIGIVALLAILTLSYRQTIHAYPTGGGAYIVAKDNLGANSGLVAGAALLVDYILTVAVSISAGVAAITSAAQGTRFAFLQDYRVAICLVLIALIGMVNLRGVRESGAIFAGPTYLFIFSMLVLIVGGFYKYYTTGALMPPSPDSLHTEGFRGGLEPSVLTGSVLVWLLMRAFAAGCTALTGVEAISNGVPAFKEPSSKNASVTITWMAVIMCTLILGTGFLAYVLKAHPVGESETLVSGMTRHTFGTGVIYYFVQASTAAILVLAANTSFADFPRLASLIAADRYLPRQFANRGDRLVFSNGIVVLSVFAAILVIIFKGNEQAMLPLYALGVFISFTLSQAGMVIHWLRERKVEEIKERITKQEQAESASLSYVEDPGQVSHEQERLEAIENHLGGHWLTSILINGLGATVTFVVFIIIAVTKFLHGAWAVVIVITVLVLIFRGIHQHYLKAARQLSLTNASQLPILKHRVIVPISGIHRGILPALRYAQSICHTDVTAVYIEVNPQHTEALRKEWEKWGMGIPLKVIESPYRSLITVLLKYIREEADSNDDASLTVVLPEFVPHSWWQQVLYNQEALHIKGRLLFEPGIIVTSVPYHLRPNEAGRGGNELKS